MALWHYVIELSFSERKYIKKNNTKEKLGKNGREFSIWINSQFFVYVSEKKRRVWKYLGITRRLMRKCKAEEWNVGEIFLLSRFVYSCCCSTMKALKIDEFHTIQKCVHMLVGQSTSDPIKWTFVCFECNSQRIWNRQ